MNILNGRVHMSESFGKCNAQWVFVKAAKRATFLLLPLEFQMLT